MTTKNTDLPLLPRWPACMLAIALASGSIACDSSQAAESKPGGEAGKASQMAESAMGDVEKMKADLANGEDIQLTCAGNLGAYGKLADSTDDDEKKAYQALLDVCFVDAPTKMIAALRAKLGKGELDSFDTVDLETLLGNDKRPTDGKPAEVAADAQKLLEIEIPTDQLSAHTETAKQEKAAGETVSMGCIKAKQVVEKSGKALESDEKGKAALEAFAAVCPPK